MGLGVGLGKEGGRGMEREREKLAVYCSLTALGSE
jgi:hypothetical protein